MPVPATNLLKSAAQRLRRDRRGNVAMMGAILFLPLTLAAFGAVEFSRTTMMRSELQDALDAASLAVARSSAATPEEREAVGAAVLRGTLSKYGSQLKNVVFDEKKGVVTVDASLVFNPILPGLAGKEFTVRGVSSASLLGDKLEVALVLDNTYSMLGTRLDTTKIASTNFVNTLETAAKKTRVSDALKVSLVPFSTTVNVGPANRTAEWMDRYAASPAHSPRAGQTPGEFDVFSMNVNRFSLFDSMGQTWAGCVESRPYPYDTQDTPPSVGTPATLFVPYFAPDEPDGWNSAYYQQWTNDYLDDRTSQTFWLTRLRNTSKYAYPPKTLAALGNGYNYGPNYGCRLQPVVPLTTDIAKVKAGITNMKVSGDTYIPFGLIWGWHTVSPNAPFADGSAYNKKGVKKIVVLMTDGQNAMYENDTPNASIYSGAGFIWQNRLGIKTGDDAQRRAALDARVAETCRNMKAKGIVIYTIRVEVPSGSADVLRNCATDTGKFFDVRSASALDETFQTIADSILRLRISA